MAVTLNYGWPKPADREAQLEILLQQVLDLIDAALASAETVYACNVTHSAAQAIGNASATALTFDQERRDDGGLHSTSVNPTRLTAPVAGWYDLSANVEFANNATGFRTISFRKNAGATVIWASQANAVSGSDTILQLSRITYLAAGDYVQLFAFQNSGGALNVQKSGEYSPEFQMVLVRAV